MIPGNIITEFQGEFRFLSNFWPCRVFWGDHITPVREWPNVEMPYQAAKTFDRKAREVLQMFHSPGADVDAQFAARMAKKWGKNLKPEQIRPDWEEAKVAIMRDLLRSKFTWNPDLAQKLVATDPAYIQEGNRWGDTFWGVTLVPITKGNRTIPAGTGNNNLGRLLMQVRHELRHNLLIPVALAM